MTTTTDSKKFTILVTFRRWDLDANGARLGYTEERTTKQYQSTGNHHCGGLASAFVSDTAFKALTKEMRENGFDVESVTFAQDFSVVKPAATKKVNKFAEVVTGTVVAPVADPSPQQAAAAEITTVADAAVDADTVIASIEAAPAPQKRKRS